MPERFKHLGLAFVLLLGTLLWIWILARSLRQGWVRFKGDVYYRDQTPVKFWALMAMAVLWIAGLACCTIWQLVQFFDS